jgi:ribose 5-phosphate isomerase B
LKFYIACDHAGFDIKESVIEIIENLGNEVVDLGTNSKERVDYPDFAHKLSEAVLNDEGTQGVLICGTGIGMSISANKHEGIRAALCHDAYTATMARAHNDANILCFGERVIGLGVVSSIIKAWCITPFEGGRHANRVKKIELKK